MPRTWEHLLSDRALNRGDSEIAAILAGFPAGVLAATGGFPNPATFPTDVIDDILTRLVHDDPSVSLQYTPSEGLPSVREYLRDRQEQLQGRRPAVSELTVTSGAMECIDLLCKTVLNPGDEVAVEAPTYFGAIMAFTANEAMVTAIPMDEDGLVVELLAERLADGYRPKFLYTIPEYQNPSGRTLSMDRRTALIELCRRFDVLIFEDVAYREITFDGTSLPSLWSMAPDLVVQAGTFSKIFTPGVRLGWAAGPSDLIEQIGTAKQNTDQCAGALGQRLVEEYGRAGHFERQLPTARMLYAARWTALREALESELPDGCRWSVPAGGFFTWLTLPDELDTVQMRRAAIEAGVAYVAGSPFYIDGGGHNELRFSFSHLSDDQLGTAVQRLSGVIRDAVVAA